MIEGGGWTGDEMALVKIRNENSAIPYRAVQPAGFDLGAGRSFCLAARWLYRQRRGLSLCPDDRGSGGLN